MIKFRIHHLVKPQICMILLFLWISLSGCAALMSSATSDMMANLSAAILNNDDLELVETGAPAYLLMIDSFIAKDPDNHEMLSTAALLYSAYADLFVENPQRAKKMAAKALNYAEKSVCLVQDQACGLKTMNFQKFEKVILKFGKNDIHALFALGNAWAGWIMANKSDPAAIADLARIETIMKHVIFLDESYREGAPYIYLGSLSSFLPPALGGHPDEGKRYFEKAIELSNHKNLSAKVSYAKFYARMVYDRELHDQLLNEVIHADPYIEGSTLINIWSQKQAKDLLKTADDYF